MKNYRNDEFGFEMNVSENWSLPGYRVSLSHFGESIVFGCPYYESFTIVISRLSSQPLPEQTENELRRNVRDHNYTSLEFGRITIEDNEHFWARYYKGRGEWIKKYLVVLSGIEYAFTATCFYQSKLLERESVWDEIIKSFRIKTTSINAISKSDKQDKNNSNFQERKIVEPKRADGQSSEADFINHPPAPAEIGLQRDDQDIHTSKHRNMKVLPYNKGDFIGDKYEVYGTLGQGGFGVVYLVYSHETGGVYALKTFRDEYLADQEVRKRFEKEASIWVELERHPYLVRAFVDELLSRIYIGMEYIAPNEEGLNTLEGYLQRRPPDLAQSLRWASQICHGMEYAYSKGLRAHRDLKPVNIMISQEKIAKITDFGLAGVFSEAALIPVVSWEVQTGRLGLSGQTMKGKGFGTPTHMAPEQFDNAAGCDERSDIYSFGIVLYQMASGGQLPFLARLPRDGSAKEMETFWLAMHRLQCEATVSRLDNPLYPIIQRCLEKSPEKRYQDFKEVRKDLELLLLLQTGEVIIPPQLKELEAWEWNDKGGSLNSLGRYEEAIRCLDKALELNQQHTRAWNNKGTSLDSLCRHEEAVHCYDKALELDPRLAIAWYNKGGSLSSRGRYEEAIQCLGEAIQIDPHYASAWNNKGTNLDSLGRYEEAIRCYDRTLGLDPRNYAAWYNKGCSLKRLGRDEEAIHCFDKALELNPLFAGAWNNKGNSLNNLGRSEEATHCFDKALELDPLDTTIWNNKGNSLHSLGCYKEAIHYYDKSLELDQGFIHAWHNKGACLNRLGHYEEAIRCFDKALQLDPHYVNAWYNKGNSLDKIGRAEEAIRCYDKALQLDPRDMVIWYKKALLEDKLRYWREAARSYQQFLVLAPAKYLDRIEYARQRLRNWELNRCSGPSPFQGGKDE